MSEGLNLGKILVLQLLHHEDSDEGDEADDDEVIAHVAHVLKALTSHVAINGATAAPRMEETLYAMPEPV